MVQPRDLPTCHLFTIFIYCRPLHLEINFKVTVCCCYSYRVRVCGEHICSERTHTLVFCLDACKAMWRARKLAEKYNICINGSTYAGIASHNYKSINTISSLSNRACTVHMLLSRRRRLSSLALTVRESILTIPGIPFFAFGFLFVLILHSMRVNKKTRIERSHVRDVRVRMSE